MLEPGPETDLKVAEACGIDHTTVGPRKECYRIDGMRWRYDPFRPSTDLNDAFLAAEKVGLFDKYVIGVVNAGHRLEAWWVYFFGETPVSTEPTPALAICAAIIKLKEKP